MRYVGHLDLHRAWERVFRRSTLPLVYSLGFHPQPRLNLACALPVGFSSQCELLDAWLEMEFPLEQIRSAISAALPPGLEVIEMATVDLHTPALQTQVESAQYLVSFLDAVPDLPSRVDRILAAQQLPRRRRDKAYDLRPLIESITLLDQPPVAYAAMRVVMAAHEGATGRPEELLDELGVKFEDTRIHRERLVLKAN